MYTKLLRMLVSKSFRGNGHCTPDNGGGSGHCS